MNAIFTGEDKEWLIANLYSEMEDSDEDDDMLFKENFLSMEVNPCRV